MRKKEKNGLNRPIWEERGEAAFTKILQNNALKMIKLCYNNLIIFMK